MKKTYGVSLSYTIASSQLLLTDHAKIRILERDIIFPHGVNTWHMVEDERDHNKYALGSVTLKYMKTGLVIVVAKHGDRYKLCTAWWDNKMSKVG